MAISSRKNSAEAELQKPKRTKKKLSGAEEVMWMGSMTPYIIKSYDIDFGNPQTYGLGHGGVEWKNKEW